MTHLAEQSFWDVIDAYSGPGIASHQNCRALAAGDAAVGDGGRTADIARPGEASIGTVEMGARVAASLAA